MKGKKLLLDVTNTDGEKTYLLQYQKQQSMAEECYKIEKSILTRNPKETKTTVFTRVSTKELKTLEEIKLEKKRKAAKKGKKGIYRKRKNAQKKRS